MVEYVTINGNALVWEVVPTPNSNPKPTVTIKSGQSGRTLTVPASRVRPHTPSRGQARRAIESLNKHLPDHTVEDAVRLYGYNPYSVHRTYGTYPHPTPTTPHHTPPTQPNKEA